MNQIFYKLAKARLKLGDKDQIRENLHNFMLDNPVRNQNLIRHKNQEDKKSIFNNLFNRKYMFASIVLVIVLTLSGGVSYAANDAVPGDILYPVKVNINEEVKAALKFNNEGKAQWEVERYANRLNEAVELASKDQLHAEQKTKLQASMIKHKEKVDRLSLELEEKGNFSAANAVQSSLEARLAAYQQILANWEKSDKSSDDGDEDEENNIVGDILESVETDKDATIKARIKFQSKSTNDNISKEKVEIEIEKFKQEFGQVQSQHREKTSNNQTKVDLYIDAKLLIAQSLLKEAIAQYEQEAYLESYLILQKAFRVLEEIKIFMEATENLPFDIDINSEGEIEIEEEIEIENHEDDNKYNQILIDSKGKVQIKVHVRNEDNKDALDDDSDDDSIDTKDDNNEVEIEIETESEFKSDDNDSDDNFIDEDDDDEDDDDEDEETKIEVDSKLKL